MADTPIKKVLVLGAGLVARPLVKYFLDRPEFELTVASRTVSKAEELIQGHPRGRAQALNSNDDAALREAISRCDLAISLLPATQHVTVAEHCIALKKPMATTSYVSPAMRALEPRAIEAGIMILNECGLDPGIDHMSAKRIIDDVHGRGGKITGFSSSCGGLPAPEANTNPWGYKFSWSPRGVVTAAKNAARFLKDGEIIDIPGPRLFANPGHATFDGIEYEIYPNRDSLGYIELYDIPETRTMFRGTFRNMGHCDLWLKLATLNLFDESKTYDFNVLSPAAFLLQTLTGTAATAEQRVREFLDDLRPSASIDKMRWLGLFGETPTGIGQMPPLDLLASLLLAKLQYEPGERDMIILHHDFDVEYPADKRREHITSTLIDYGIPAGDTSMARTVSLPVAIGVRLMLEGVINLPGVHVPVVPEIYNPILDELETMGIKFVEKTEVK